MTDRYDSHLKEKEVYSRNRARSDKKNILAKNKICV